MTHRVFIGRGRVSLLFAAALAVAASCKSAEKPPDKVKVKDKDPDTVKPSGPARCDLATVEDSLFCETCKLVFGPEGIDINGMCKRCNNGPSARAACVKKVFACETHDKDHAKPCPDHAGKKCCAEKSVRSLIVWKCPGCDRSDEEAGSCRKCKKALEKTCEMSETWPHGGKSPD